LKIIKRFGKYWLPVIIYAAIIFYFSSLSRPLGEISLFLHADKLIHFFEFGFLGLLLRRAFLNASAPYLRGHAIIWTIVFGIMYGLSDEFHQSFVPGREVAAVDLLFDSVGVLGSLLVKIQK
jgi:VanZ family protein